MPRTATGSRRPIGLESSSVIRGLHADVDLWHLGPSGRELVTDRATASTAWTLKPAVTREHEQRPVSAAQDQTGQRGLVGQLGEEHRAEHGRRDQQIRQGSSFFDEFAPARALFP